MMVSRAECAECDARVDYITRGKDLRCECGGDMEFVGKVGVVYGSGSDIRPEARELVEEWRGVEETAPDAPTQASYRECANELEELLEPNELVSRRFPADEAFTARKKPVEVDVYGPVDERVEIDTREGTVVAEPGEFVIRGVEGEIYPIGVDIFERTYEPAFNRHRNVRPAPDRPYRGWDSHRLVKKDRAMYCPTAHVLFDPDLMMQDGDPCPICEEVVEL